MQHFMIPCDFGGRKAPFPIYVGDPKVDAHPLHYQSWWLSSERGGSIPQEVMDSFEKLHKIALENNVSFEELCVYAMGEALGDQNADNTAAISPDAPPPPPEEPQQQMQTQPEALMMSQPPEMQTPVQPQQAGQPQQYDYHQERVDSTQPNPNEPYPKNQD